MDYLYENLGDERFQEFCSTLLAKEFPNLQAFPIGQPDGGRDSIAYYMDSQKKDFIVFQVKFVKNTKNLLDPHKWLISILKEEVKKVEKLIGKGAKRYYLLTNVDGTAHLDKGSKDIVNKILKENISIPAQCWWRDDISRRFEKDPLFKWSFPEIINGQDILNSLIFQNISEKKEIRDAAVKAYLTDQYKIDNEVKFKQIDLQNKLVDLYTDVPLRIKKINRDDKKLKKTLSTMNFPIDREDYFLNLKEEMQAAEFLLNTNIQNRIERILLEGGPGQGKSTISQYICQVHRARLLGKEDDLKLLPNTTRKCQVRIPFKIDLRHIASWVEKKNPYIGKLSDEMFKQIWINNLESFIVGNIVYHSSINDFNTSDLIAIIKNSHVLFVFDGFDEIADMKIRKSVVDFIDEGINRIKANSKSIQVLITSRPAAFSSTVGFSVDIYPHFELTDITISCTEEYVDKWIKANRLDSKEANDIKRLVKEKLQIPHLKGLAKSPMQLAIFISLLRTRGESLPNKRTALYDSYIDLFFNREAEKNSMIRDHRDLIMDIHKYLAWILHSEAELYKTNGCIDLKQLKEKLEIYLKKEGHSTDITENLFQVVEERVCALVSRVQGTYEFEVQPLREYFCAKYLYETAQFSPAGKERTGTKPDRFNAISRNLYWNNVVRFYAGCFDKGELPMLIYELKELQNDNLLRYTNYPQLLTSQLLSDWVFSQAPKYLKDVVRIIIDNINIGNIINQNHQFYDSDELISLPNECGGIEIVEECFRQLKQFPHNDYATELIGLIVNNKNEDVLELWKKELKNVPQDRVLIWLKYAYKMEIIHKIDKSILTNMVLQDTNLSLQVQKIRIIILGNRFDVINDSIDIKQIALNDILSGNFLAIPRKETISALQFLSILLHPFIVNSIIYEAKDTEYRDMNFIEYINNRFRFRNFNKYEREENSLDDNIDKMIRKLYGDVNESLMYDLYDWRKDIAQWDILIEKLRGIFEDKWAFKILSAIVAGIEDKISFGRVFGVYSSLSDCSLSLCKRAKCAHYKRGDLGYWEQQFNHPNDLMYVYLMFFTWATPKIIIEMYDKVQSTFNQLTESDILLLSDSLSKTTKRNKLKKTKDILDFLQTKSSFFEFNYLISFRLPEEMQENFICNQNDNISKIFNIRIMKSKFRYLIAQYLEDLNNKDLLNKIKDFYQLFFDCGIDDEYMYHRYFRFNIDNSSVISIDIANSIIENSKFYPRILISMAERSCRLYANEKIKIVGKIADDEKWFD